MKYELVRRGRLQRLEAEKAKLHREIRLLTAARDGLAGTLAAQMPHRIIPVREDAPRSVVTDVVTYVSGVPCPNCDCTFSFEITEGEASSTRKDPYDGFGNGGDGE